MTKSSPFLPVKDDATTATSSSTRELEFVAVVGTGAKTTVGLYDPATKKTRLIPVGGGSDGVAVLRYDASRSQIVIRAGGTEKVLVLRKEHILPAAPAALPAVATGGSAPPPTAPNPGSASKPIAPLAVLPITPTLPPAPGANPASAPTPAEIAKKQEDARLLTTDLLEIGLAQRQAHEAAQKQAAGRAPAAMPVPDASGKR